MKAVVENEEPASLRPSLDVQRHHDHSNAYKGNMYVGLAYRLEV